MKNYLELLEKVLNEGVERPDRTGVGTQGIFGHQMRFDISKNFPLLTTKKCSLKAIIYELLWFLRGDTNISFLKKNNVTIWDEWADENGELGPIYGKQWRSWLAPDGKKIDQITQVIESIKNDPYSRRHLVVAFNPGEIKDMALPPCHAFFQFYVAEGELSCQLYQRSADIFLGLPFNIASYSLLTLMIAQVCKLKPKEFIHSLGDAHLYNNHKEQARLQLQRKPLPLPQMKLNPEVKDIFDFSFKDFELINYNPHPHIAAEVAI